MDTFYFRNSGSQESLQPISASIHRLIRSLLMLLYVLQFSKLHLDKLTIM